jgi:hypothetical protein
MVDQTRASIELQWIADVEATDKEDGEYNEKGSQMAIDDEEDLLKDMYGAPEDADTLLTKRNRRSRRKTLVLEDLATAYATNLCRLRRRQ